MFSLDRGSDSNLLVLRRKRLMSCVRGAGLVAATASPPFNPDCVSLMMLRGLSRVLCAFAFTISEKLKKVKLKEIRRSVKKN
jgi:hypothetical protein